MYEREEVVPRWVGPRVVLRATALARVGSPDKDKLALVYPFWGIRVVLGNGSAGTVTLGAGDATSKSVTKG